MSDIKGVKAVKDKDLTGREAGKNKEKSVLNMDREIEAIIQKVENNMKEQEAKDQGKKKEDHIRGDKTNVTAIVDLATAEEKGKGMSKKITQVVSKKTTRKNPSKKNPIVPWHSKALALLTDLDNPLSMAEIAKRVGVTRKTLSTTVNHNEAFQELYATAVQEQMVKAKPRIDQALIRKAQGGDTSAIRLFYERAENMQNRFRTDHTIDVDVF